MHTCFFLINRSQHAMQKRFFQCERFVSATHIAFFHIGNMPYASGTAISFGPGLENPMNLRSNFGRGLENLIRIRLRFVRGMENPSNFWFVFIWGIKNRIGIGFIRPFAWSFVGRIQYALHGRPKKWRFFYPFDHRSGRLWGVLHTPLHGRSEKWRFFFPFDHCRGRL